MIDMALRRRPAAHNSPLSSDTLQEAYDRDRSTEDSLDTGHTSDHIRRTIPIRVNARLTARHQHAIIAARRRRVLMLEVGTAICLLVALVTSSARVSSVYASMSAPAAAQDSGLPPPPTDASGHLLPPTGTTVPQPQGLFSSDARTTAEAPAATTPLNGCTKETHSSDGNPYPLCPGPMPQYGGNC